MKTQYKTTFPDVIRFLWMNQNRSKGLLIFIGAAAAFVTRNAGQTAITQNGTAIGIIAWFLTAAIIFVGIFLFAFVASVLSSLSKRNKTFMTENTIELHDDRFTTENRYGKGEYKWDIVQKVVKTKRFIVMYVTKSTGIIVPKRAFQELAEWESFCDLIETYSTK